MPNWCSNELTITGEQKQITKFMKDNKTRETDLSFNKSVPMPFELRKGMGEAQDEAIRADNTKKYGYPTWYEWSIGNWGTKWDAKEVQLFNGDSKDAETLEYSLETAWSPPVAWLEQTAKKYPELEFRLKYEEEGMEYFGLAKASEGVTTDKWVQ